MERRDLLKMIMAATGVAMVGSPAMAYQIKGPVPLSATMFKPDDVFLFNEIAEMILPRTDTPGAKDANVGEMALILANDCYTKSERNTLVRGLITVNEQTQEMYGKPFLLLDKAQRSAYVSQLDIAANAYNTAQKMYYVNTTPYDMNASDTDAAPHFFTLIKQLTLFCFFTSKIGATEVLRYEAIPGKYNGALEYKKGDRAWAT